MSVYENIRNEVQLPGPVAIWVLSAHLYGLLIPLVLLWAFIGNQDYIAQRADYPALFVFAAAIMMAASAFEIAQNTFDRWYLTPDTGSANGTGFCDMIFYCLIVMSQAIVLLACVGSHVWIAAGSIALAVVFPWFYLSQRFIYLPLALLGTGSVIAGWFTFEDPVIFLQLLMTPLTNAFFSVLLRTGAQALHGFTTVAAASNVVFIAWAMISSADGEPTPWWVAGAIALGLLLVVVLVPRLTAGLQPTPRNTDGHTAIS